MNKLLVYTVVAILLGTVTMVAPLALLGTSDPNSDTVPEYKIMATGTEDPSDQNRTDEAAGTLGNNDLWTRSDSPSQPPSQDPGLTVKTADTPSDLSPIGIMIIPSFVVALGVFVYLKKRTM
ncbi:MAG TPA: hypothetical protein ENN36_06660 [Candidatus Bathyarchaeota archaeon]|nr:hypothetical protein [Candidatus Bathyarchaeota archaeon]